MARAALPDQTSGGEEGMPEERAEAGSVRMLPRG